LVYCIAAGPVAGKSRKKGRTPEQCDIKPLQLDFLPPNIELSSGHMPLKFAELSISPRQCVASRVQQRLKAVNSLEDAKFMKLPTTEALIDSISHDAGDVSP
jgi:hypothetical protein